MMSCFHRRFGLSSPLELAAQKTRHPSGWVARPQIDCAFHELLTERFNRLALFVVNVPVVPEETSGQAVDEPRASQAFLDEEGIATKRRIEVTESFGHPGLPGHSL